MEAIWVAAEMRAGEAYAHTAVSLAEMGAAGLGAAAAGGNYENP